MVKKIFFLIFFLLVLPSIARCLEASSNDPGETRYFRGDTSNGFYILGITQSDIPREYSLPEEIGDQTYGIQAGIRVWVRTTSGNEIEITGGSPVAVVSKSSDYPNTEIKNGSWDCPSISLAENDRIVVRLYLRIGSNPWQLAGSFSTEELGVNQLNATRWNVFYWLFLSHSRIPDETGTRVWVTRGGIGWGDKDHNSRIEGFRPTEKITLFPANTGFTVLSSIIPPQVKVVGNRKYLNIFWTTKYFSDWKKEIAAKCYLNCLNPGDDIESNCVGYQSCNSTTIAGSQGVCTITDPNYDYTTANLIVCKIYDPSQPEIEYKPYVNLTFWPLNFTSLPLKNISATVGDSISLPIRIKNLGLLEDNYTINITPLSNPNFISIKNNLISVRNVKSGEMSIGYAEIIPLSSSETELGIWVYSDSPEWFDCSACPPNFVCEQASQKCSKYFVIRIESDYSSLGEISLAEIILLIFVALLLIYRKGP